MMHKPANLELTAKWNDDPKETFPDAPPAEDYFSDSPPAYDDLDDPQQDPIPYCADCNMPLWAVAFCVWFLFFELGPLLFTVYAFATFPEFKDEWGLEELSAKEDVETNMRVLIIWRCISMATWVLQLLNWHFDDNKCLLSCRNIFLVICGVMSFYLFALFLAYFNYLEELSWKLRAHIKHNYQFAHFAILWNFAVFCSYLLLCCCSLFVAMFGSCGF